MTNMRIANRTRSLDCMCCGVDVCIAKKRNNKNFPLDAGMKFVNHDVFLRNFYFVVVALLFPLFFFQIRNSKTCLIGRVCCVLA